ncbi:MAG: hypothetical protein ACRDNF_26630 [Streptosporangiaceae bacterium]
MAGFRDRGRTPSDLRLIPHPAVTLVLVFGGTIAVEGPPGRSSAAASAWSRARTPPESRPTAATPISPTCTMTSCRSPG